jgi:hypothetical protein
MWLNTPPTQFRTIDGLSIRFAESEERDDHALHEYAALVTTWWAGGYATAGSEAR